MKETEIVEILEKVHNNYKSATYYKDKGTCLSGLISSFATIEYKTKFSSKYTVPDTFKAVWKSQFDSEVKDLKGQHFDNYELKITGNTAVLIDKIKFKRELLDLTQKDFDRKLTFPIVDASFLNVTPRIFLDRKKSSIMPLILTSEGAVCFIDKNESLLEVQLEDRLGKTQLTIDIDRLIYTEVKFVVSSERSITETIDKKFSQEMAALFSNMLKTTADFTDVAHYARIKFDEVELKH